MLVQSPGEALPNSGPRKGIAKGEGRRSASSNNFQFPRQESVSSRSGESQLAQLDQLVQKEMVSILLPWSLGRGQEASAGHWAGLPGCCSEEYPIHPVG